MRRTFLVLVCLCVLALACAVPALAAARHHPRHAKPAVVWAAGDIKWADSPAMPGARIAPLWGNPAKGAYGALKSIPGGSVLKLHTHSHDQKVIVISGTIVFTLEGQAPKDLGAGSYIFIPAVAKHSAECKAGADCIWLEEYPAAADLKYVEEAGAKK
jgi:quercetin dioxygenase-like cupin family protein